jgi:DNA-binding response OmpR family regulator
VKPGTESGRHAVDDDAAIRALLAEYLVENALRVSAAETSAAMSAILAEPAIDLIVLDLRLAGEDGMAVARNLRSHSAIPIIMLTDGSRRGGPGDGARARSR